MAGPGGTEGVVVGIDGSEGAEHALRWAIDKKAVLGPVTPVTAFQLPVTFDVLTDLGPGGDLSLYRAAAETRLMEAIANTDPTLRERARVIEAHPGVALVEAAAAADLLVVGTRGRGSVTAALLGSVSSYCARYAAVPTVVIPPDFPADRAITNVVVGVDGSDHSLDALRWALAHMDQDGLIHTIGALSTWGYTAGGFDPPIELLQKSLLDKVERVVSEATGSDYHGPDISIEIVDIDARVALRRAAGPDVDLLVCGSRGAEGVPYLLLGSVSDALIHHPTVPTVVIPSPVGPTEA